MTTTQQTKKTQAEIKVLAINTLYEYAEKYYLHEKQRLTPFIGMDIFKVDGSFKAKYDSPKLSDKLQLNDGTWVNAHYWFEKRHGYFDINVKICVNGGSYDVTPATAFCQYEQQSFSLFNILDGKLTENNNDISWMKRRYDVNELKAIADTIKEAAKVYEAAEEKMPHQFKGVFDIERLTR